MSIYKILSTQRNNEWNLKYDSRCGSETHHLYTPLSDKLCGGVNPRQLICLLYISKTDIYMIKM